MTSTLRKFISVLAHLLFLTVATFSSIASGFSLNFSPHKNSQQCSGKISHTLALFTHTAGRLIDMTIGHLKARQAKTDTRISDLLTIGVYARSLRIQRALNMLTCAKSRLKQIKYGCVSDGKYAASTWMIIGHQVTISESWFSKTDSQGVVGTLIHEATHKCGAVDAAYFNPDPPRDIGPIPWDAIADTYDYWIEVGFCIPGEDC